MGNMATTVIADDIAGRLLRAVISDPRAAAVTLAQRVGVSRNTVQARLNKWDSQAALWGFDRRVAPAFLGYPLRAYVFTKVKQRRLAPVAEALREVPEVTSVDGLSGGSDLLIQVVARDADDLYRIAGTILDIKGVKRTTTSLVMRELIEHRVGQLIPDA